MDETPERQADRRWVQRLLVIAGVLAIAASLGLMALTLAGPA